MNDITKLAAIKSLLGISDSSQDAILTTYLALSKAEILSWMYSGKTLEDVTDVPDRYEPTQIMAVVAGYGINGAENQTAHSENGISRSFKHDSMVAYIRAHVLPYAEVV